MRNAPHMPKYKISPWILALMLTTAGYAHAEDRASGPTAIVLAGTVLTPDGPLEPGFVSIERGRIVEVSHARPRRPDAVVLNTNGVIAPGFVDLHNHVSYDVLPRWSPRATFTNKLQWRMDLEYQTRVAAPYSRLSRQYFCEMNRWGELRALVGGTTSISATAPAACIYGLVRNVDAASGFYSTTELNLEHVLNVLEIPPATAPAARLDFAAQARFLIASAAFEALMLHVAEGTDAEAHEEFEFLQRQSLLNPKGVLIHGIALNAQDFAAMAAAGTALVWSPRSNVELYGRTADVRAALDSGVDVAIAPDWAITGSGNMLAELHFAARWNEDRLGGVLSARQLVEMATSTPARAAGIDDEVGALIPGLRADLVVLDADDGDPYRTVLNARPRNVRLVLIDGVPLYGDHPLMRRFYSASELEELDVDSRGKELATPAAGGVTVADLESTLDAALRAEGTSLAALFEPEGQDFQLDSRCRGAR